MSANNNNDGDDSENECREPEFEKRVPICQIQCVHVQIL